MLNNQLSRKKRKRERKTKTERKKERKQKDSIGNLPISIMLVLPTWSISNYKSDVIGADVGKRCSQLVLVRQ